MRQTTAVAAFDIARDEPQVVRGLVADWPCVRQSSAGDQAFLEYVGSFDNGTPVDALLLRPEEKGRIFYNAAMDGFNYVRDQVPVQRVLEQLWRYAHFERPPSVAIQSALVSTCLPGFERENTLDLLPGIAPRIWIGNDVVTPAHFDESHNVACVIAGRRRFTLFPPEQVDNLYLGPLDFAPTPTPISLVDFRATDFDRFPRFREALEQAQVADLAPGDALFIPQYWWHHVQSLARVNALVNYWWPASGSPSRTSPLRASAHRPS